MTRDVLLLIDANKTEFVLMLARYLAANHSSLLGIPYKQRLQVEFLPFEK